METRWGLRPQGEEEQWNGKSHFYNMSDLLKSNIHTAYIGVWMDAIIAKGTTDPALNTLT